MFSSKSRCAFQSLHLLLEAGQIKSCILNIDCQRIAHYNSGSSWAVCPAISCRYHWLFIQYSHLAFSSWPSSRLSFFLVTRLHSSYKLAPIVVSTLFICFEGEREEAKATQEHGCCDSRCTWKDSCEKDRGNLVHWIPFWQSSFSYFYRPRPN